jgi:O-antigen/teichoic acid export membrane protein
VKNLSSSAKNNQYFQTEHLNADLKGRSVRGGAITMAAQACKFGLSLGSNIVLARMLTPADYGLIGMVTTVTGFITLFKDLGLSMATVQKDEISHEQVSNLFWVNVALAVITALIAAATAPAVAQFYHEPRLIWITLTLTIGFIISGLGVQHSALLNRQMHYGALVFNDVFSMLISTVAAIVAAMYGASYWALVILPLTSATISTAGLWLVCKWRPSLPTRKSGTRSMLAFGGNLTGFNVINYFARNLDNVLIGRFWGVQQLGLYSKAYQLLLLPLSQINDPITKVAVPTLSRLADSPERYRQVYLRILEKLALLTMPIVVFMVATSDWLVQIILGSQWNDASRLFMLLGFAGVLQPIASSTGWLFISQGRTHHMFQWGVIGSTTAVVSFFIGLPWGATGVATSYSIIWICVTMPLLFWFVGRTGPIRTKDFYITPAPIAFAALCTALVLVAFRKWVAVSDPVVGCGVAFGITGTIFLITLFALPKGRLIVQDLRNLSSMLKAA